MFFFRGRAIGLGLVLTCAGAGMLFSSVKHQLTGVEATATLLERTSECQVEYQLVGSSRRSEQKMDCKAAAAFQNLFGVDKVKLYRNDLARLSYLDAAGAPHEVQVGDSNAPAGSKIGAQFSVVYDPTKPDDVRRPLGLRDFAVSLGALGFGLSLLMLGFRVNPLKWIARGGAANARPARAQAATGVNSQRVDVVRKAAANWETSADAAIVRAAQVHAAAGGPIGAGPDPASFYGRPVSTFGKRNSNG